MRKYQHLLGISALACVLSTPTMASESIELSEYWFTPHDSRQYLQSQPIVFKLDKSCQNKSQLEHNRAVNEALHNELMLNTDQPLVEQTLFKDYSLFWKHKHQYYQLTAVWEYDVPALYRLEFYQSDHPEMNQGIKQLDPAQLPAHAVDAIEVKRIFAEVLDGYIKQGAVQGASILVSSIQDDLGNTHEVTFLNDIPVSWAQAEQACQLDSSLSAMNCVCDAHSAHSHGEES